MGFTKFIYFIDDGVTGTKRDRKDFVRMTAELEKGHIGAVMVKDLSRLGRDHILVDQLIEETFPTLDIRLIAISENLDSAEGEDEFTPFRNLMNEWYSRDISKKVKLTNVVKGNAGIPLSPPPYGYVKDPENPKRWVIDPEIAPIVQRIFRETLDGKGVEQIAAALERDKIVTPMNYWYNKGLKRGRLINLENPYKWNDSTIVKLLALQEYCGDVINFKTYSKSFKLKKRIENPVENMAIFKNVHEPIVDRDVWEKVQAKRGKMRKRKTRDGERNMFSGLLVCADCGKNLWYHFNQKNHEIKYFNCSNYKGNRGTCNTTHYVRVDFLEQVIMQEVRRLMKFALEYETEFVKLIAGKSTRTIENEQQRKQKQLYKLTARDRELDKLFNRMYEDNIAGKIDDERFGRMSRQYTTEQTELAEKIKLLQSELEKEEHTAITTDTFIGAIRKYANAETLTSLMLNELIEKIEVHHAERVGGINMQSLIIHYNCVGYVEIPNRKELPEVDVTVGTRQGVATSYIPAKLTA